MMKRLMIAAAVVTTAAALTGCCCNWCCKCCCKKGKPHPQQSQGAFFVEAVEVDGGGCPMNGNARKAAPAPAHTK